MNTKSVKTVVDRRDGKLAMAHFYVAFIALAIGGLAGLLQTLVRSGKFELPSWTGYYQILTMHGVVLGLVLTTFFIMGFQLSLVSKTSGTFTDKQRKTGWIGFWTMTIGTVMAAVMILTNQASVLYTFYAPLQAHALFYLGLTLVIVGSWIDGAAIIMAYSSWRKANPGKPSPLLTFMSLVNTLMWIVATIGVAATVLFQLLPWSLGLVERVDVLVSRTLFWYFGHPLVYFWLLPAYMAWYAIVPKIIGGKIFSDSLARMSFILFLLFSIPVGFHHQLMEPGIDPAWKFKRIYRPIRLGEKASMGRCPIRSSFHRNACIHSCWCWRTCQRIPPIEPGSTQHNLGYRTFPFDSCNFRHPDFLRDFLLACPSPYWKGSYKSHE